MGTCRRVRAFHLTPEGFERDSNHTEAMNLGVPPLYVRCSVSALKLILYLF